jgi:hypothetical protein
VIDRAPSPCKRGRAAQLNSKVEMSKWRMAETPRVVMFSQDDEEELRNYHSDPVCSPRQLTFRKEAGAWTAAQVGFEMCM